MATTEERGARSGSIKRPACRQTELYFCERRSWVEGETDVHLVRCSSLVASPPRLAPNRRGSASGCFCAGSAVAVRLTNLISRHRTDLSKTDKFGSGAAARERFERASSARVFRQTNWSPSSLRLRPLTCRSRASCAWCGAGPPVFCARTEWRWRRRFRDPTG